MLPKGKGEGIHQSLCKIMEEERESGRKLIFTNFKHYVTFKRILESLLIHLLHHFIHLSYQLIYLYIIPIFNNLRND